MTDRFSDVTTYLAPAAVALGGYALGLLMRGTGLHHLSGLAKRTPWKWDDVLVHALRGPVVLWCTLGGLYGALELLRLPATADRVLGQALLVAAILSVTWAATRFTVEALRESTSDGALPSVSLIANVAAAAIWVLGALVALERLGISITPIVTALGVGGLAVALALQDTLANLFAGIRILAARQVRPGDYIRLESGDEGYVQDITWAQTTIRQPLGHLVIVPNAKLAGAITANYNLPDLEELVAVKVGVAHGSDLAAVERVTLEVAREAQREAPGGARAHEPVLRFHTAGESAMEFNVVLRTTHFDSRGPLVSEFLKRLDARYRKEGIRLAETVRVVRLADERLAEK
ncbi:MAG: mechanosensitive ion channel family protein [Gemmatimonadales bacterium]|jgi:small-conductance mechanosensitive channel